MQHGYVILLLFLVGAFDPDDIGVDIAAAGGAWTGVVAADAGGAVTVGAGARDGVAGVGALGVLRGRFVRLHRFRGRQSRMGLRRLGRLG
jgi:hypothetical protein